MARRASRPEARLEDRLAALHAARLDPRSPASEVRLRAALDGGLGLEVASAAETIGEAGLDALYPLLAPAFARLLAAGTEADRGCKGKLAIAELCWKAELDAAEVFLAGIAHVQPEAVWGGTVDTAASLRGTCGLGLAMLDHPDALERLADLLADPEDKTRAFAGLGLGNLGRPEAVPLLRFKARVGDASGEVMQEVFGSLLSLRWSASLPFVAGFLAARPDTTAEAALLALGSSKRPEAFPALRDAAAVARPALVRCAMLALGLLRTPEATAWLLGVVREGALPTAAHAIAALGIQRHDEALADSVRAAIAGRRSRTLEQAFETEFGG